MTVTHSCRLTFLSAFRRPRRHVRALDLVPDARWPPFDSISKQITELKKEVNKREQQKTELADVIEQDKVIELKGRRPMKLAEAFTRPPLHGKRLPGEVVIHQNGLGYQSPMGSQKVGKYAPASQGSIPY